MGKPVNIGRHTHLHEGEVTVFLIGMRFGRPWKVRTWWPVFSSMPRMLRYLSSRPDSGLLGFHSWPGRTTLLLSYWKSPDHLIRFASDADAPHLEPWRRFTRTVGADPSVGIWHETYRVRPGDYEGVYVNMPAFGLAAATGVKPVGAGTATARQRMRSSRGSEDVSRP